MIIDAAERFSQRNTRSWFQNMSGQRKHRHGSVVSFQSQSEINSGTGSKRVSDDLTPAEIAHLQNTAGLLVTHSHEITVCFYRKVVKTLWWKHDRFRDLVICEESRLLASLLELAEKPAETSLMAFFLADNWIKYRYMGDLGESYGTITYCLNEALEDVLGEYFTVEVVTAWRKALAPGHVFNHVLHECRSR